LLRNKPKLLFSPCSSAEETPAKNTAPFPWLYCFSHCKGKGAAVSRQFFNHLSTFYDFFQRNRKNRENRVRGPL